MNTTLRDAILEAYTVAKPHLMDELRDDQTIVLLVRFKLGDLRELDATRDKTTIISGG
jgi:hypothetical protein